MFIYVKNIRYSALKDIHHEIRLSYKVDEQIFHLDVAQISVWSQVAIENGVYFASETDSFVSQLSSRDEKFEKNPRNLSRKS